MNTVNHERAKYEYRCTSWKNIGALPPGTFARVVEQKNGLRDISILKAVGISRTMSADATESRPVVTISRRRTTLLKTTDEVQKLLLVTPEAIDEP